MEPQLSLDSTLSYPPVLDLAPAKRHALPAAPPRASAEGSSVSRDDDDDDDYDDHLALSDRSSAPSSSSSTAAAPRTWTRVRSCAAETVLPDSAPVSLNAPAFAAAMPAPRVETVDNYEAVDLLLPRYETVDNFEAVAAAASGRRRRRSLSLTDRAGAAGNLNLTLNEGNEKEEEEEEEEEEEIEDEGDIIRGICARLARFFLLSDVRDVRRAHLCADLDLHIASAAGPSWDCGFRNVATLISALLPDVAVGAALRRAGLFDAPDVAEVVRRIEAAWAAGYDADGAAHYGGQLSGKWMGATEVAVLLHSLGLRARVMTFDTASAIKRARMLDWVWRYFDDRCGGGAAARCVLHGGVPERAVPPLFLQWQGHSVTVVGAERTRKGETRLLVLDPVRAFADNFAARSIRAKMMVVRRGECHPELAAERFQVVFLDRNPLLAEAQPGAVEKRKMGLGVKGGKGQKGQKEKEPKEKKEQKEKGKKTRRMSFRRRNSREKVPGCCVYPNAVV